MQAFVFGENASSRVWHFPHDVSTLQQRFADRDDGTMVQFADLRSRQKPGRDAKLRESWQSFLAGSMYHVAGVDAVNNYTGMGFLPFTKRLCMDYDGLTKQCGYQRIWEPAEKGGPPLADLMKLETIVVQKSMASQVTPPDGWTAEEGGDAVVFRRDEPVPWEGSDLSFADDGVEVGEASSDGPYSETGRGDDRPGRRRRVRQARLAGLLRGGGRRVGARVRQPGRAADRLPAARDVRHAPGQLPATGPRGRAGRRRTRYGGRGRPRRTRPAPTTYAGPRNRPLSKRNRSHRGKVTRCPPAEGRMECWCPPNR